MTTRFAMLAVLASLSLGSPPLLADEPTTNPVAEEDPELATASRLAGEGDASFGPVLVIDRVDVAGNTSTSARLIRRTLPVKAGDVLRAGDPRLVTAEYKVLALGYFRSVDIGLHKADRRGHVILTVTVVERGTVILEGIHFGATDATPWWAGLDVTERNFAGTGFGVGLGAVFAGRGGAAGASGQSSFQLRLADTSVLNSAAGFHLVGHYVDASEPYRVMGNASDDSAKNFAAFDYERLGARGGVDFEISPQSRVSFGARVERVDANLPSLPTRQLPDGTTRAVELALRPDVSRVVTATVRFDRDTRSDPVLTTAGDRLLLHGEFGAGWLGGDYDYGVGLAKYQRWWAIRGKTHVVSMHLTGGVVLGDAPLFDLLHVGDLNRLVSPRVLGLVVSTTSSHDFLGTSTDDVTYGEVGGVAEVQYSYRLFRDRFSVYGGDLFFGAGLWALANTRDLQVRDESLYKALPIDLLIDIGLRIDTEVGVFELSLANAVGRVPL